MRAWLLTATDCSCTSLDACALFEPTADSATDVSLLHVRLVRTGTTVKL
jgi:hypothetical protein